MTLSPDEIVYFHLGPLAVNATLVFTWLVVALLVGVSAVVSRNLRVTGKPRAGQNALEALVEFVLGQIRDVTQQDPRPYLPFVGTLFLFIVTSNVLSAVPGFHPPTGSLTTTMALALSVLLAVPVFGIGRVGLRAYLTGYLRPSPIMLPFTIIGELSRTLALAVRLFGNIMSGSVVVAILLSVAPLFFPVIMQAFGLLIGIIQAYIFAILAIVYIASATAEHERRSASGTEGGTS
ncbi:MAG: F0F1 ATP synthase subunit A [Trueperaceae bacterium]